MNNAADAAAAGAQAAVVDLARLLAEMQRVGQAVNAQTASVAEHGDALGAITERFLEARFSCSTKPPSHLICRIFALVHLVSFTNKSYW